MVNLNTNQQTSLAGLAARKRVYDTRMDELKKEYNKLIEREQADIAALILEALNAGVPQTQIGMQGLGYNHVNGIRSFFGLAMRGDVKTLLQEFIMKALGEGGTLATALADVRDNQETTYIYQGENWDGQPRYYLHRAGAEEEFAFVDSRQIGGGLIWQRRRGNLLTEQEAVMVEEATGLTRDTWAGKYIEEG